MLTKFYRWLFVPSVWTMVERQEVAARKGYGYSAIVYVLKNQYGRMKAFRVDA